MSYSRYYLQDFLNRRFGNDKYPDRLRAAVTQRVTLG